MWLSAPDLPGAQWRRSTKSGGGGGAQCVELAHLVDGGAIRDSKNPGGPVCRLGTEAFGALIVAAREGQMDRAH